MNFSILECSICKERNYIRSEMSTFAGVYGDTWTRKQEERMNNLVCDCHLSPKELEEKNKKSEDQIENSIHERDRARLKAKFGFSGTSYGDYFSNPKVCSIPNYLTEEDSKKKKIFYYMLDCFRKIDDNDFIIFADVYHTKEEKYASDKDMRCYLKVLKSNTVNYNEIDFPSFLEDHIAFENAEKLIAYLDENYGLGEYFKGELSEYSVLSLYAKYRYANLG